MPRLPFRVPATMAALIVAGTFAAGLAAAVPANAASHPRPSGEGPAGPPARTPSGRVARPPKVAGAQAGAGCPAAPYGPHYYAPGTGRTVALTFDDGPGNTSTQQVMSVLTRFGVPATFFNIGENAAAGPGLVRQEANSGFPVGNHTWDHPDMTTLSAAAQAAEMDRASAEQHATIGTYPCLFRPPYGTYNSTTLSLARQRRMTVWLWSVDTEDWKADGSASPYWVHRIIRLAEQEGGALSNPVVLMHNAPSGDPATVAALPTIIRFFRNRGYTFTDLMGHTGIGYLELASGGGVHNFAAPSFGSPGAYPAGVTAAGIAYDAATNGYWVVRSDGGISQFHAPWLGSLRGKVAAGSVTSITGSGSGYLVLTADGRVHAFGAHYYGSTGALPAGVTAVGITADPATGGYWVVTSNGGIAPFHAPWLGSLRGKLPTGAAATGISESGGGYLIVASNGLVHAFGTPWYGSDTSLPSGVTAAGIAGDPATGGYWVLTSDGGVANFHAPWFQSLKGKVPAGQAIVGLAGE